MTLTFLHTTASNQVLFESLLAAHAPDIPAVHSVHADLLARAVAQGDVTPEIARDVEACLRQALDEGAAIVLCTCSTLGICADQMNDPRVLRVDRAMAEQALAQGPRVLVAACVNSTLKPTVSLLRQINPDAQIETLLMDELWPAFLSGDREQYWQGIAARLRAQDATQFDSVVLAQASMAGAAELLTSYPIPVLSSPVIGLQSAIAAYRNALAS